MATVTKTVLVESTPIKTLTLELSGEEALALLDLTGVVGGSPKDTRRKYTDRIYNALASVPTFKADDRGRQVDGTVIFAA